MAECSSGSAAGADPSVTGPNAVIMPPNNEEVPPTAPAANEVSPLLRPAPAPHAPEAAASSSSSRGGSPPAATDDVSATRPASPPHPCSSQSADRDNDDASTAPPSSPSQQQQEISATALSSASGCASILQSSLETSTTTSATMLLAPAEAVAATITEPAISSPKAAQEVGIRSPVTYAELESQHPKEKRGEPQSSGPAEREVSLPSTATLPSSPPPPPQTSGGAKKKRPRATSKRGAGEAPRPPLPQTASSASRASSATSTGRWTSAEHQAFLAGLATYGREWKRVAMHIPTRTSSQVRSHAQKYFFKLQQAATAASAAERHHHHAGACTGYPQDGASSSRLLGATANPTDALGHHPHASASSLLTPSVRANVERILAQPETVQAEVDETLQRLRERYLVLQQRLRRQQQQQRGGSLGNHNNDHSSIEESCQSLQDSELIALHVLQGGLEPSSPHPSSSSSSMASAAHLHDPPFGSVQSQQDNNDKPPPPDPASPAHHPNQPLPPLPPEDDEDDEPEDDGHNPQAPPSKRSKHDDDGDDERSDAENKDRRHPRNSGAPPAAPSPLA